MHMKLLSIIAAGLLLMMPISTASIVRVAVVGGGPAGCFLSKELAASSKFAVTLFDAGRKPGGRTSTRLHKHHGEKYCFDHGAQYISPKSDVFKKIVKSWELKGIVDVWNGAVGRSNGEGHKIEPLNFDCEHYVGVPTMGSLCEKILSSIEIEKKFGVQVCIQPSSNNDGWCIIKEGSETSLGTYDWVVCTDRTMAAKGQLPSSVDEAFTNEVQASVISVPSLACMMVLDSSVSTLLEEKLGYDSIRIDQHPILSWVSNCSSKPEQKREDGKSCWTIQANPTFSKSLILEVEEDMCGASAKEIRSVIAKECEIPLYTAFMQLVEDHLCMQRGSLADTKPVFLRGHRWGAAFPSGYMRTSSSGDGDEPFFIDPKAKFIAIGDYFDEKGGRIESAYLSALSGAKAIISNAA